MPKRVGAGRNRRWRSRTNGRLYKSRKSAVRAERRDRQGHGGTSAKRKRNARLQRRKRR